MPDKQNKKQEPPGSSIDWQAYADNLSTRKFNAQTLVTPEKIYLSMRAEANIIGTAGNLVAFTGLPKAGKSTFLSFCIASAISGEKVNGFKVHRHEGKEKICLIDTEQSPGDFARKVNIIKKICWNAGHEGDIFKNFDAYLLSDFSAGQIVMSIAAYLHSNKNCGVLIIDGLLDCLDNMNDESKSKKLVRYLKKLAKQHDCLLIGVLHLGKKDKLSLGHLGSSVDRAAQSVIQIEKTKDNTFKAIPQLLRSCGTFHEIEIGWNEEEMRYEVLF